MYRGNPGGVGGPTKTVTTPPKMIPEWDRLSRRPDFKPSYVVYTMPTDADFLAKYGALAHLRCRECKAEWRVRPGFRFCPNNADHLYIDWVNYEDLRPKLHCDSTR